jgi:hypothetical protein
MATPSSASQADIAPGWSAEGNEVFNEESSVDIQPRDPSQAPTHADDYKICQGDSPNNEHSYTFGNKEYKPALEAFFPQMGQQERDHAHDKRCEGLCVPWKGNTSFCHSSFCSSYIQTNHAHHIDVIQLQTTLSPSDIKETFVSQLGTIPSETATPKGPPLRTLPDQCRKRHYQANQPLLTWQKTCVSIPKRKQSSERILSDLSRLATLNKEHMLQTAVCNAVTSINDDIHEYILHDEQ